jgi:hypothetical protein
MATLVDPRSLGIEDWDETHYNLVQWAENYVRTTPYDLCIGPREDPYMHRWYIVQDHSPEYWGAMINRTFRSDADDPHDHPWENASVVLVGRYTEQVFNADGTQYESFVRGAGHIVHRPLGEVHRLELAPGEEALSLFLYGPRLMSWGFITPDRGKVPWRTYLGLADGATHASRMEHNV